jgi:hypothetical protein
MKVQSIVSFSAICTEANIPNKISEDLLLLNDGAEIIKTKDLGYWKEMQENNMEDAEPEDKPDFYIQIKQIQKLINLCKKLKIDLITTADLPE